MKARVIVNPRAGSGMEHNELERAASMLREAGWDIDLVSTEAPGDATKLARDAVQVGCEVVVACGGDGTINEVLQPLVGNKTALAVIPKGTVNVFAREFHLPRKPLEAARALVDGRIANLDVGMANGRYFLLWASVGFDAEVVRRAASRRSRRLRFLPFVVAAISTIFSFQGVETEVEIDGVMTQEAVLMATLSNVRAYAFFELASRSSSEDGALDLCIFTGRGFATRFRHVASFLVGHHLTSSGVRYCRVERASIRPREPLPVQIDGEVAGVTPLDCRVVPQSLRVILPK